MVSGIVIFAVLAAVMVLLVIGGFFLAKRLASDRSADRHETDPVKLAEWQSSARTYDAEKAVHERFMGHEAYKAAVSLEEAVRDHPGRRSMILKANLPSLEAYRSFDAIQYAEEHIDRDEALELLSVSSDMRELQHTYMPAFDQACVMMADEPDDSVKAACRKKLLQVMDMMRDDLLVIYAYTAENGKTYHDTAAVGLDIVSSLAGRNGTMHRSSMLKRFLLLESKGFRCERCGRSPLSGAELAICDSPVGPECLCQDCRV